MAQENERTSPRWLMYLSATASVLTTVASLFFAYTGWRLTQQSNDIMELQTQYMEYGINPSFTVLATDSLGGGTNPDNRELLISNTNQNASVQNLDVLHTSWTSICLETNGQILACSAFKLDGFYNDVVYSGSGSGELARITCTTIPGGNMAKLRSLRQAISGSPWLNGGQLVLGGVVTSLSIVYGGGASGGRYLYYQVTDTFGLPASPAFGDRVDLPIDDAGTHGVLWRITGDEPAFDFSTLTAESLIAWWSSQNLVIPNS